MSSKNVLLAGASGLALAVMGLPGSASAELSPFGTFTFGYTGATIDPTSTTTPPLAGAVGALSSQINSQLNLDATAVHNTFYIDAGSSASASPAAVNSNAVEAIAVNNQFTGSTASSTYAVNPANIPTGGAAVLGTSQLNTSMASQSATLGAIGVPGSTTSVSTTTIVSAGTNTGTISLSYSTGTGSYTVANTTGLQSGNYANGSVLSWAQVQALAGQGYVAYNGYGYDTGALSFSSGTSNSFSVGGKASSSTSWSTSTTGGTAGAGNSATFTAASNFAGAPVNVDNNLFAARAIGNTVSSAISGALPVTSIATAAASVNVSGVSVVTPVGTSITTQAPISVTNVQQNVNPVSSATISAANINSVVSATFTGTVPGSSGTTTSGYLNGTVSTSGNAISASASGNLATLNNSILPGGSPTLGGGLAVVNVQGNQASSSSSLTVSADTTNPAIYVQAFDSTSGSSGSLTTLTNSNAVLNSNSISGRVSLNEASQTLSVDPLVFAGSASSAGSNTTVTSIYPVDTSAGTQTNPATTLTASADYLNASVQRNVSDSSSSLSGVASVSNAIIGFFGGVSSGTVSAQANTVSVTALGNTAALTTSLGQLDGGATSVTTALQHNDGVSLSAIMNPVTDTGVFVRISDANTVSVDASTATASMSAFGNSSTTVTPGFANATLNIGGASAALGNTVSTTVIGNNATAAALLGTVSPGSTTTATSVSATLTAVDPTLTPAGTLSSIDAQHAVAVVQQNLNLGILEASFYGPSGVDGSLYQITANGGLTDSTATIGYNNLRSTAAGNVAQASATLNGAAGNLLPGGTGVFTVQGNQGGVIEAHTAGVEFSGSTATIYGAGVNINAFSITNSTAQVSNNNVAALAAGNSASGNLTFGAGTIAAGAPVAGNNFDLASNNVSATYAVGNTQVNAGTTLASSNLDGVQLSTAGITPILDTFFSSGTLTGSATHLNIGAGSVSNSTAAVNNNTVSTNTIGNEYYGTASGFTVQQGGSEGTQSLALANIQANLPTGLGSSATNTTATSFNVYAGFAVATAGTVEDRMSGAVNGSGGTVTNSTLSVNGNTQSAAVTLNNGNLSIASISGSGAPGSSGTSATVSGSLDTLTLATAAQTVTSAGPVTLSNNQTNLFQAGTSGGTTSPLTGADVGALALSGLSSFVVGWNESGSGPTNSTFQVNGNSVTASATGNNSALSAGIASGPAFGGGVGLNNVQANAANPNGSASTVTIAAAAGLVQFGAGALSTGWSASTGTNGAIGGDTTNSTISVSGNQVSANVALNKASASVTAPQDVIISPLVVTGSIAQAGLSVNAEATAAIALANTQTNVNVDGSAYAGYVAFSGNAQATNGTVAVDSNSVSANAVANTATATVSLPRIDSSVEAFNAQGATSSTTSSLVGQVQFAAGSNTNTVNTPVSVSNNLATASSTVNNYAATLSGLGQTGASSSQEASLAATVDASGATASPLSGLAQLVNAQFIAGGGASATVSDISGTIGVANSATTNSPLTVNGNMATASVIGNNSAQSVVANGVGASMNQGGIGITNAQNASGAAFSAAANNTTYGVTNSGSAASASPINVNGNTVGATATANSASLNTGFGTVLNAAGTPSSTPSSTTASTGTATAVANFALLNNQSSTGSTVKASANNTVIGSSGGVSSSPVNVLNNVVYASAYGNSASMGLTAPMSSGSLQSTSMQSNYGMAINASVTNTSIGANVTSGSIGSPLSVSGNVVRAQAVGNMLSSIVGH